MRVPPSPGTRGEVVLEVGVAGRELGDARRGHPGERRPAEIRVDDDPGGVDDGDERRCVRGGQASLDAALQDRRDVVGASRSRPRPRCDASSRPRIAAASARSASTTAVRPYLAFQEAHRLALAQLLDGRNVPDGATSVD